MQKSYLALVGLLGLAVSAQAADIIINANVGTQQTLALGECIIVTPTGDLTVASLGGSPAILGDGNNVADIQDGGNVSSNSLGGSPAIQFNGGGTVNVSGTVTTNSFGGSGGIFFNNSVAGVVNISETGQISTNAIGGSPGIFSDGQVTVVVDGSILTSAAAASAGISAGDNSQVTVGQNGVIDTSGPLSPGISLGNNAMVEVNGALFTNGTSVTVGENSNVTIGSTGSLSPSGTGVLVQEGSTATNNGIISATGLFGSGMAGFEGGSGEPNVNLTNNGTIAVGGTFASGLFSGDMSTGRNTGLIDLQGATSLNGITLGDDSMAWNSGTIVNDSDKGGAGTSNGINVGENSTAENSGTITINGTNGRGVNAGDGSMVSNTDTGTINVNGNGSLADLGAGLAAGANSTADNAGWINVNGTDAVGIYLVGDGSTATNDGTINHTVNNTGGIATMGDNITVNNNGTVSGTGNNSNTAVSFTGSGGILNNTGTLGTTGNGAPTVLSIQDITVNNDGGTIAADGNNTDAILTAGGTVNNEGGMISSNNQAGVEATTNALNVTNTDGGTISGRRGVRMAAGGDVMNTDSTIEGTQRAIDKFGDGNISVHNTNGMIVSQTGPAIRFNGSAGNDMIVNDQGQIYSMAGRGIATGDGDDSVTNTSGNIFSNGDASAIVMGAGNDTLWNTSGNIYTSGNDDAVTTGGGNDTVTNDFGMIYSTSGRALVTAAGDDMVTNDQGQIYSMGMYQAVSLGGGNDTLTDDEGTFWNAGGTHVIGTGGGDDTVNFTLTTVTRTGGAITDDAVQLNGGADTLNIFGAADINGTMNGNGGADDLCMELFGVSAQQVVAALTEGTAVINPDGTVTLSETGTLDFGGRVYRWASFDGSAIVKTVTLQDLPGLTPNQQAIGAALGPAFQGNPSDDLEFVLMEILDDGLNNFGNIANQLSPQSLSEAFRRTGINNATFLNRQMDGRMDSLFTDGFESGNTTSWTTSSLDTIHLDASSFVLLDPTQNRNFQNWDRRLASLGVASGVVSDVPGAAFGGLDLANTDYDPKAMYDGKKMIEAPLADPRRFGIWLAGQGILADVDQADGDVEDFNYDTASVTLGVDYRVNREVVLGVLFNWGNTDAALDGNGSRQEVNTYSGGLYAGWQSQDDGWFANGFVIGGASEYNQSRRIAFAAVNRTAYSDPEGWQLTTGVNSGYLFNLNRSGTWQFGPVWGLQYTHLEMDSFTETGAGSLNLNVGQQDIDSLRSALGMKLKGRWQVSQNVALEPVLTAQWLHEFLDDSTGVTGAFSDPAAGSFIVNTQNPDREFGLVGLTLNALIGEQWSAFLAYDAQFSEQYLGHGISGGARFEF